MNQIIFALINILFFTGGSMVFNRISDLVSYTYISKILVAFVSVAGMILGSVIFDWVKKINLIHIFMSSILIFSNLQLILPDKTVTDLVLLISIMILYCTYNINYLFCRLVSYGSPWMWHILFNNIGYLFGSIILQYTTGNESMISISPHYSILILSSGALISSLFLTKTFRLTRTRDIFGYQDIILLFQEYDWFFWGYCSIEIANSMFKKYMVPMLLSIGIPIFYATRLVIVWHMGKILLHFPMVFIMRTMKSKTTIILGVLLSCGLMFCVPFVYKMPIILQIVMFFHGGFSMIEYGFIMYLRKELSEKHAKMIVLDTSINKLSRLCVFVSVIVGSSMQATIYISIFTISFILQLCSIFYLLNYSTINNK